MLRAAFVLLGFVAILGFVLVGAFQTSAETRYPKVQWVTNDKPDGPVERARIDGLPRLKGTGPEGSAFVERKHRNRSVPFAIEQRVYALARFGCLAALVTSGLGFLLHRRFARIVAVERGEFPA